MTHSLLHWESILKRSGNRATRQRAVILDAICAQQGHASLYEIFSAVRQRDRTVDRSTIYRALHLFIELGIVVEAKAPGGETRYEIRKLWPHHHLICRQCGDEREVSSESLQAMLDDVFREHSFRVATDHLMLFGICEDCALRR